MSNNLKNGCSVTAVVQGSLVHAESCYSNGTLKWMWISRDRGIFLSYSGYLLPEDEDVHWTHGNLNSWWPPHRRRRAALLVASALAGPQTLPPMYRFGREIHKTTLGIANYKSTFKRL